MRRGLFSGIPFNVEEKSIDDEPQRAILRRAAQDTIVLLKNEPIDGEKLLPISDRAQSIAVIGPNANIAVISGGGSARLAPTYAITPLAGIQQAVAGDVTVEFTVGAVTDSSLPLLDPYIKVDAGGGVKPGCLFKFWNSSPSSDFIGTDPLPEPSDPTWTTTSLTTDSYLFDNVVSSLCASFC
jgi:beta-glucosidase